MNPSHPSSEAEHHRRRRLLRMGATVITVWTILMAAGTLRAPGQNPGLKFILALVPGLALVGVWLLLYRRKWP